MTEFDMDSEDSEYSDSDVELQNAFLEGKLKPGLNTVTEKSVKTYANNVSGIKQILISMKSKLPWIETLDSVNKLAPLAPEMALQMQEQEERNQNQTMNNIKKSNDAIFDDFKREMTFHRQAQSAVLESIPKLKSFGVSTKRPDDYFAEMAKTDDHMHKVRESLMKRQVEMQQREKVRQIRIQRKEGKALQAQQRIQKQQEKKEVLDRVKKVRKGVTKNLDFLDGKKNMNSSSKGKNSKSKIMDKRKQRDAKFGFGGRKRGLKRNTKESSAEFGDDRQPNKRGGKPGKSGKPSKVINKRPGKNKRQKSKARGKK